MRSFLKQSFYDLFCTLISPLLQMTVGLQEPIRCSLGILALVLCVFPAIARSATKLVSSPDISQYAHSAWTAQHGSFRGGIIAVAQTTDGYLWVATNFGLLRFDGVRFVEWKPPQGDPLPEGVEALLGTRDGSLWIGGKGLARWKDGVLTHIEDLDKAAIRALLEEWNGALWVGSIGSTNGLCRIPFGTTVCPKDKISPLIM
jgi:ligand-binding sensor domain-containing protein